MIRNTYGKRKGLQGPIYYPNGRVLYFDPVADQHWDPTTDFYVDEDELNLLQPMVFDQLAKDYSRNGHENDCKLV